MRGRLLLAGLSLALTTSRAADAQGPITGPPILYTGCVLGDLTACTSFWFAYRPDFFDFWTFDAPYGVQGQPKFWYLMENWGFRSTDGTCTGVTISYSFRQGDCAITQRHQLTFTALAIHLLPTPPEQIRTLIVFSPAASVTPEPATILLMASGLAGIGAAVRRRRQSLKK
jgi:hypothetical protein